MIDFDAAGSPASGYLATPDAAEAVAEMEQTLRSAGRSASVYTNRGIRRWFFDANVLEAYDAAAALAWERTLAFLNAELRR